MHRHLFFDLDRTLWDFDKNSQIALKTLFEQTQEQHQLPSFHKFNLVYQEINAKLWKQYGKGKISKEELRETRFYKTLYKLGLNNKELGQFFNDEYLRISPLQKSLFPNAIETLEQLSKDGYQMHIITNGFEEVQRLKLTNCGLAPYFKVILSSEAIGINKPDIKIFQHAMQLANAKAEESVMIGDDMNVDVMGAERAGMFAIHFDPNEELSNKNNDFRIRDLSEIPALLPYIFKK